MYMISVHNEKGILIMRPTGIERQIDQLGRVVIPKEFCKSLGINSKDYLSISSNGTAVIIQKCEASCVFCNSTENIVDYKGKKVCIPCLTELKAK